MLAFAWNATSSSGQVRVQGKLHRIVRGVSWATLRGLQRDSLSGLSPCLCLFGLLDIFVVLLGDGSIRVKKLQALGS